jgi:type III secretion system FlhB-like substrate exporter
VTAKAQDDDALAMREAAQEAGVPVLRNIELARQLLANTETGDIVPAELFDIIATVVLWAQDVRHELELAQERTNSAAPNAGPRAAKRPAPGEDLTRYGPANASTESQAATGARWRKHHFSRYVPRRWRQHNPSSSQP